MHKIKGELKLNDDQIVQATYLELYQQSHRTADSGVEEASDSN